MGRAVGGPSVLQFLPPAATPIGATTQWEHRQGNREGEALPDRARTSYPLGMDESASAAQVWRHLESLGCTRSVRQVRMNGVVQVCVEIHQGSTVIASDHHDLQSLANSGALLAAIRRLGPPPRSR